MNTKNYTRVQATELKPGDRIILFHERTGDKRVVTLGQRKGYEGDGSYWEFHADDGFRYGWNREDEAMRCE